MISSRCGRWAFYSSNTLVSMESGLWELLRISLMWVNSCFNEASWSILDNWFCLMSHVVRVASNLWNTWCCLTGPELRRRLVVLNSCPIQQARWCVISQYEMMKCENMIMAFSAKNIKPDLNCVMGTSVQDCMQLINVGDADLITLDAADVYQAGMLVTDNACSL